jgi:phosphonate transport system substrate-binding protein
LHDDFHAQTDAIKNDAVDLIYANSFDAAMLIRDKGFLPLVKAKGKSDEAIIAVNAENLVEDVAHLEAGTKIAYTDDPDVKMMGMIMLEPADLDASNIESIVTSTNILVAKKLLQGDADVGIFLAEAFDDLSKMIKMQLRVLVKSEITDIHHSFMIGPKLLDKREEIQKVLLEMNSCEKGKGVLSSLGFDGWETVEVDEILPVYCISKWLLLNKLKFHKFSYYILQSKK